MVIPNVTLPTEYGEKINTIAMVMNSNPAEVIRSIVIRYLDDFEMVMFDDIKHSLTEVLTAEQLMEKTGHLNLNTEGK